MLNSESLILSPREAHEAAQKWRVVKRSVDARQRDLRVHLTVLTDDQGKPIAKDAPIPLYEPPVFQDVHHAKREAVIIGAGPAGLFAALTLIEHGIKPIIYERGKEVSERKKDIALLNRNEGLNPESNYCFGEGGAGTFSDGKLFSRSKKRGNMQRVMEPFISSEHPTPSSTKRTRISVPTNCPPSSKTSATASSPEAGRSTLWNSTSASRAASPALTPSCAATASGEENNSLPNNHGR